MRVRLKGINRVSKRLASGKGKTYYYAWKGGPRLEGQPGTPEFYASYVAAVESHKRKPKADLQSLIDRYVVSADFLNLAEATKQSYKNAIRAIEAEFSDLPIKALADRAVRADFLDWRDRIGATAPRQADIKFRVLARIVSWAFNRGLAPANPCERAGRLYQSTRIDKIWTVEQEEAFYASAPVHLHLALMLALWTGQRQQDLLKLPWSDYDGKNLRFKQRKTKAYVLVPVGAPLRKALEGARAKLVRGGADDAKIQSYTILGTAKTGSAWTRYGFSSAWRKACAKAGVSGVTFHDLRGTAVTRLAVAGCTVPEIATITGHSLKDVADILDAHYLNRDSNLASNAIRKLEKKAKRPTKLPTARRGR